MVIPVRDVAREVVLHEELVQERVPVAHDDGRVPGRRHHQHKQRPPWHAESQKPRPTPPQHIVDDDHRTRNDNAHQPLRQQRCSDEEVEADEPRLPTRAALDLGTVEARERARHGRRQQRVEARRAREDDEPQRRSRDGRAGDAEPAHIFPRLELGAARRPAREQHRQHAAEGRAQPRRKLRHAEQPVRDLHQPVEQRGLLEPRVAAERGRHPVTAREHLSRHLRVPRLVRPQQRHRPEAVEVDRTDRREQHDPRALCKQETLQV
jgi:hypothetical protein